MGANEKAEATYHGRSREQQVEKIAVEALVDQEDRYAVQRFHTDASYHYQVRMLAMTLAHFDRAAREEGVDDATTARILNRVLFGDPDGTAQLRRERLRMIQQIYAQSALTPPLDMQY